MMATGDCHRHDYGSKALEEIDKKNWISKTLTKRAGDICSAHVSATNRSYVHSGDSSGNVSSREGTEQISNRCDDDKGKHDSGVSSCAPPRIGRSYWISHFS